MSSSPALRAAGKPAASPQPSALVRRWNYLRRICSAYLTSRPSHLTFWHDTPQANARFRTGELGDYYMDFPGKADYAGPFDGAGIPLLDYHGVIGRQYNPIAIAQYGLGNFNLFRNSGEAARRQRFLLIAAWLRDNLRQNAHGVWVWNHEFDWDYRTRLIAPWYSGLAQGQGISVLVRAHQETGDAAYLDAAARAFESFRRTVDAGGVVHVDAEGNRWIEEYLVEPPTHILNGFLWASWGVYDYWLATRDHAAKEIFDAAVRTLAGNLRRFDAGFWSLYEISGTRMPMLASHFYHALHIVQLRIMHRLSGEPVFSEYADRWQAYAASPWRRNRALAYKALFKLLYY